MSDPRESALRPEVERCDGDPLVWDGSAGHLEAMFDAAAYRASHFGNTSIQYELRRDCYVGAVLRRAALSEQRPSAAPSEQERRSGKDRRAEDTESHCVGNSRSYGPDRRTGERARIWKALGLAVKHGPRCKCRGCEDVAAALLRAPVSAAPSEPSREEMNLLGVAKRAAAWFREYEAIHTEKANEGVVYGGERDSSRRAAKAARNRDRAVELEKAINDYERGLPAAPSAEGETRKVLRQVVAALTSLHALVVGESPSLLEDDHHDDMARDAIEAGQALLRAASAAPQTVEASEPDDFDVPSIAGEPEPLI